MASNPLNAEKRKPFGLPKRTKYHIRFPIEYQGKIPLNHQSKKTINNILLFILHTHKIKFNKLALITISGHPKIENGNKADENQVSKTSSSCLSVIFSFGMLNFFTALSKASSLEYALTQQSSSFS